MRRPGNEEWARTRLSGGWAGAGGFVTPEEGDVSRMILDLLKGIPDVRSDLVVYLRHAIEENRYYVPEELVAERMVCYLAGILN